MPQYVVSCKTSVETNRRKASHPYFTMVFYTSGDPISMPNRYHFGHHLSQYAVFFHTLSWTRLKLWHWHVKNIANMWRKPGHPYFTVVFADGIHNDSWNSLAVNLLGHAVHQLSGKCISLWDSFLILILMSILVYGQHSGEKCASWYYPAFRHAFIAAKFTRHETEKYLFACLVFFSRLDISQSRI